MKLVPIWIALFAVFGPLAHAGDESKAPKHSATEDQREPISDSRKIYSENDDAYKPEYRPDVLREKAVDSETEAKNKEKLSRDENTYNQRQVDIQSRR